MISQKTFDSLNELAAACHKTAVGHGFYAEDNAILEELNRNDLEQAHIRNMGLKRIALIGTELSEMAEAIRKVDKMSDHVNSVTLEEEEAADVLIRLFDLCGSRNLRIGLATRLKMEYNKTRPYKHGKLA